MPRPGDAPAATASGTSSNRKIAEYIISVRHISISIVASGDSERSRGLRGLPLPPPIDTRRRRGTEEAILHGGGAESGEVRGASPTGTLLAQRRESGEDSGRGGLPCSERLCGAGE